MSSLPHSSWQDLVLSAGLVLTALSFVPQLRSGLRVSLAWGGITLAVSLLFTGTFLSLHLWFSAVMEGVLTLEWALVLARGRVAPRGHRPAVRPGPLAPPPPPPPPPDTNPSVSCRWS